MQAGSYTLMERLSITLFGFLTFYLLVRVLNPEDFGVWTLFVSITSIIELVRNGLIRSPLIRYIAAADQSDHGAIQAASFLINLVCTVLSVVVLILLAQPLSTLWDAGQISTLFYVYGITSLFLVFFTHFECVQHAYMSFQGTFVGYFAQKGFFFFAWR